MKLKITDKNGNELFSKCDSEINCVYENKYEPGDKISVSAQGVWFFKVKLDKNLKESIIYAPGGSFDYEIPTALLDRIYPKDTFAGTKHEITVSEATDEEAYGIRNISLNPYDLREQKRYYPHAYANLVTRNEPCFFERNAIDGVCENKGHGDFPYHSWADGKSAFLGGIVADRGVRQIYQGGFK